MSKQNTTITQEAIQTSSDDDALIEFMNILQNIDENQTLAKENERSMSDNNGGRIIF